MAFSDFTQKLHLTISAQYSRNPAIVNPIVFCYSFDREKTSYPIYGTVGRYTP